MATDFTQDSVLHFLQFKGGRVKNSDLLAHFKTFLRDHENQTYNRQLFKTFVNSVAVVKPEEGVSYVVLRKKCLGQVAGDISRAQTLPFPRSLLLDSAYQDHTAGCTDGFGYPEHHHQASSDFSSSHSSLSLAQSLDSRDEWPQRSPREEWASNETLSYQDLNYPGEQQRSLNGASNSGGHDSSYFHCHDLVPLEAKEHDWLVKGATGTWTDIYTLFRDEPSLLTKRDFITGYTILHWIAKHGDHRVLNTLWYGVNKAGLKLDVDVKTTCGYTPLHLAAIHGNNKMIRLLVYKFRSNVSLRDTSGKKAWQYVGRTGPKDLLQMLGAPHCWTSTGGSSTPSGERPRRPAATSATVKKSMSITGFLKHKQNSHELFSPCALKSYCYDTSCPEVLKQSRLVFDVPLMPP
uniref:SOWAHA-C winged helix-turn-helix domain-containing protein n=1 Tax=Oncorhynchus kisutch TaxID=8019 RepID=A0A8C7DGK8_ONCKI